MADDRLGARHLAQGPAAGTDAVQAQVVLHWFGECAQTPDHFGIGRRDASEARPYSFCERVGANRENTREVRPGTPASLMVRGQGWKYVRYAGGDECL